MKLLIIFLVLGSYTLVTVFSGGHLSVYQMEVEEWLNDMNKDLSEFNYLAASLTWDMVTSPSEKIFEQAREIALVRNRWKNLACDSQLNPNLMTTEQIRKLFLLCRGPKFDNDKILPFLDAASELAQEYNTPIILTEEVPSEFTNIPLKYGDCVYGEPDLERLMKNSTFTAKELKWLWTIWHNSVGPRLKYLFTTVVQYENEAAKNNGYSDIGEVWREELEIPNLQDLVEDLYNEIKPLYEKLHAVVRYKLYEKYGPKEINLQGPIPAHLLGNMWAQDWSSLINLFTFNQEINLNERLLKKHPTVKDLAFEAEDFYTSLGLPKMPPKFWEHSIFEKGENTTVCHGTAASMYKAGDYRMITCGEVTMDDFYVIHHEMGHIQYYMAYEKQPPIFQEGTNTAFHESIGDAIMHGVMTPQHLNRIGILTDAELSDPNIEIYLLLLQALTKLPEIPFSLIVDKYRWRIFRNNIPYDQMNRYYWKLNLEYRGIVPPENRSEKFFDIGSKFHVADNTPYIRYFLSSFLQNDIFKSLCEATVAGQTNGMQNIPLHRCDIYGSKKCGKKLKEVMKKGASIYWAEAIKMLTGHNSLTSESFLLYYKPINTWLNEFINKNNISVGW